MYTSRWSRNTITGSQRPRPRHNNGASILTLTTDPLQ